ncbi:MAG: ACP S-malonyltransferase [Deltaproteobacteria bacterium]|nr:ACP S-malonyltransferase [Deltaproteobacteria bacterium]
MSEKIAFLFPGQGSQSIGMGQDIINEISEAKEIFEQLDDICRKPISRLCAEGPMDELTLTVNLQPAVTAVNLVCLAALKKSGISAHVSSGHSLGEYAALTSSGVISPYDALRLVNRRGELMHRESLSHPGVMAAVLGMNIDEVAKIVEQARDKGVLAIANHNTAEQIVITGEEEPVVRAVQLIKEMGKKAIPLKVSGAWHCDLMADAVDDFRVFMEDIPFEASKSTMLFNATAGTEDDPEKMKDIMANQLTSRVRWYDIIVRMMEDGIDTFVEVGPKKVLTGMLKKIIPRDSKLKVYNIEDMKSLNSFLEQN